MYKKQTVLVLTVFFVAAIAVFAFPTAASAKPGAVVTYWIQVDNTGSSPATSIHIDDYLSPYVYFGVDTYGPGVHIDFIEGAPASGLTPGADVYSQTSDTNFTYNPSTGAGGAPAGFDGNVTNWRFNLNGSMAPGGQFLLRYQVQVR